MAVKLTKTTPTIQTRKTGPKLEIVLKSDSIGSAEAVSGAISELKVPGIPISVIRSEIGTISKSDVLFAETGGRLIAGFQVEVMPGLDRVLREHHVEARLYHVIYTLTSDLKAIAESMAPALPEEQIIGSAKVIAIFKSSRKGIIVGCKVSEGSLAVGQRFRIISVMGPVYEGTVESLHIGEAAVQKATPGQQAGIKIRNFTRARIGDLVESFRIVPPKKERVWSPTGRVIRV